MLVPVMKCLLVIFQICLEQDIVPGIHVPDLINVGVWAGSAVKCHGNHYICSCDSFASDSGGSIIVRNGEVFGVHQESVNEACEQEDKLVGDEDISESVKSLADLFSLDFLSLQSKIKISQTAFLDDNMATWRGLGRLELDQ